MILVFKAILTVIIAACSLLALHIPTTNREWIGFAASVLLALAAFLDKTAGQTSATQQQTELVSNLIAYCSFSEKDAKYLANHNPSFATILISQAQQKTTIKPKSQDDLPF